MLKKKLIKILATEKPKTKFHINSGIYVLSPNSLKRIPTKFIDMTDFFDEMIKQKKNVNAYISNELWIDIGSIKEFKKTKKFFWFF